jgi:fatty-acyl-CoA synthase
VPTIWLGVIECLERHPERWKLVEGLRIVVPVQPPRKASSTFRQVGVRVIQPWGMTETTPIATTSTLKPEMANWPKSEVRIRAKQGLPCRCWWKCVRLAMRENSLGRHDLWRVAGTRPLRCRRLLQASEEQDKWTKGRMAAHGSVVTIDADGYMKITDRTRT